MRQRRFSDALGVAKTAAHDWPDSFQINFNQVLIFKQLNKLGEADEVLKQLMLTYPNNLKLLMEGGNIAMAQNKFDDATDYYNKILFLDPFNSEAKNAIEKIKIIKKNGLGDNKGKPMDFISYQSERLHSADTLPEFDARKLSQIPVEESSTPPPPPPPPPPLFQELTNEQDEIDEPEEEFELMPPPPNSPPASSPPPIQEIAEMELGEDENPGTEPEEEPEAPPIPEFMLEEDENGESDEELQVDISEEREEDPELAADLAQIEEKLQEAEEKEEDWQGIMEEMETPAQEEQPADEPVEEEEEVVEEEKVSEDVEFVTESAAELYIKQGLWDEAMNIYEKLYTSQQEERYLLKIEKLRMRLKQQEINEAKIRALSGLLRIIKQKGEEIV